MDILIYLLILPIIALIFILRRKQQQPFPPGPFGWPIIGNLLQLGDEPYRTITEMREIYGDMIGIQFGSRRSVFINDLKLMKEAFNINAFNSRPSMRQNLHPQSGKRRGIIFTVGAEWTEQRRFVLKNLRDFGFGKKSMEKLMMDDVLELIDKIRTTLLGQSISSKGLFNLAVINSLWTIIGGERYSQDDPTITNLLKMLHENMKSSKVLNIILPFPSLSYWVPNLSGHNEYMKNLIPIQNFIQESITEHKKTYQEGEKRDLIDCYIEEVNRAPNHSSFHGESGDENMLQAAYDLFLGGGETTSNTLSWTCFLLAHFPEVQEKLYTKITEAIGKTKVPSLDDRPIVPYAEALVMEVMRFSSLTPFGVAHQASEDVNFHGYLIPKDTYIFGNQFAVMNDPKIWGDPENFRPERFLTADETKVLKNEALIPFAIGKRMCPAETMAKDQLFLFTTCLFQRLKVEFPLGDVIPKANDTEFAHFIVAPKHHHIIFSERN